VKQNIAKAKSELAAAGVSNPSLTLEFPSDFTLEGVSFTTMAQAVQSDLKKIGLDVTLQGAPLATWLPRWMKGIQQLNQGALAALYPDPNMTEAYLPTGYRGAYAGYKPTDAPQLTELGLQAQQEINPAKRAALTVGSRCCSTTTRRSSAVPAERGDRRRVERRDVTVNPAFIIDPPSLTVAAGSTSLALGPFVRPGEGRSGDATAPERRRAVGNVGSDDDNRAGTDYYDGELGRIHYRGGRRRSRAGSFSSPASATTRAAGTGTDGRLLRRAVALAADRGHGLSDGERPCPGLRGGRARLPELLAAGVPRGAARRARALDGRAGRDDRRRGDPPTTLVVSGARIGGWETAETCSAGSTAASRPADGAATRSSTERAAAPRCACATRRWRRCLGDDSLRAVSARDAAGVRRHHPDAEDTRERSSRVLYLHGGADRSALPAEHRPDAAARRHDIEIRIFDGTPLDLQQLNRDEIWRPHRVPRADRARGARGESRPR
jgi:hypothetical protein